jgi:hypothetical protein
MTREIAMWWRNSKEMPVLLRTLCQGGMVAGPLLLLFLIVPVAPWTVNGKPMSYAEFWTSGAGLSAALFVGLITLGTWGIAARKSWTRWALVSAPILPVIPFPNSMLPDVGLVLLNGALTGAVIYLCLFHIKSVRQYLGGGNET